MHLSRKSAIGHCTVPHYPIYTALFLTTNWTVPHYTLHTALFHTTHWPAQCYRLNLELHHKSCFLWQLNCCTVASNESLCLYVFMCHHFPWESFFWEECSDGLPSFLLKCGFSPIGSRSLWQGFPAIVTFLPVASGTSCRNRCTALPTTSPQARADQTVSGIILKSQTDLLTSLS